MLENNETTNKIPRIQTLRFSELGRVNTNLIGRTSHCWVVAIITVKCPFARHHYLKRLALPKKAKWLQSTLN